MPRLLQLALMCAVSIALLITSAHAGKVTYKKCSKADKAEIAAALSWLKSNMSKIDARMGKHKLMDWPRRSRKKFIKKLDKRLKFVCRNEKRRCQREKDGMVLYGKVVPVFKQRTIQLCTNHFSRGRVDYVATIAHEIAHLIRLNAHRRKCVDKCKKPRFSQSVGQATRHAFEGTQYDPNACAARCK